MYKVSWLLVVVGLVGCMKSPNPENVENQHEEFTSSYADFSVAELTSAMNSGKPFFLLFLPTHHPSTDSINLILREAKGNAAADSRPRHRVIVLRYKFAARSEEVAALTDNFPTLSPTKDPFLVLAKNQSEISRSWLSGSKKLDKVARQLLSAAESDQMGQASLMNKPGSAPE